MRPAEIPFSIQLLKLQEPCPPFKSAHSSRAPAAFECCDKAGISPGSPYIQMTHAEIPFSIQLLKIQEPCPPFQMVNLPEF